MHILDRDWRCSSWDVGDTIGDDNNDDDAEAGEDGGGWFR